MSDIPPIYSSKEGLFVRHKRQSFESRLRQARRASWISSSRRRSFYDRLRRQFNERQDKVIARMIREGPKNFEGKLSVEKYLRITGTRDLQDLVEMKELARVGSLKSTRYHLSITARL